EFYTNFGKELPLSTRIIITVSNTVTHNFVLLVLLVVGGIFAVTAWVKQSGKERLHRMLLETPFIGTTARKFSTAQSARTLATLLGGGIPLVNALEISVRSMSNRFLAAELDTVRRQVQEGQSFAAALL